MRPASALISYSASLTLFDTDRNLVSQALNLTIVDEFIKGLEYEYLRAKFNETSTPYDSAFLAAQSQMWIFSAYEVMRTWIQKAKGYVKTAKNSGLQLKLAGLKRDRGYTNFTALQKAYEIQALLDDPLMLEKLQDDLARTHFLFIQVETIRVALAKHEVRKREGAMMAGGLVGYMNQECGSLSYDMNAGMVSTAEISRRAIRGYGDLDNHVRPGSRKTRAGTRSTAWRRSCWKTVGYPLDSLALEHTCLNCPRS